MQAEIQAELYEKIVQLKNEMKDLTDFFVKNVDKKDPFYGCILKRILMPRCEFDSATTIIKNLRDIENGKYYTKLQEYRSFETV